MKLSKTTVIVLAIIVVALIIRLLAVTYGLPLQLFNDEYIQVASSLKMLDAKTLFLPFSYLPSLGAYLLMPFILAQGLAGMLLGYYEGIEGFRIYALLNSEQFLIYTRIIAALAGALSVWALYALGRASFGLKLVSSVASFWLAFDFLHWHASVSGRFWIPLGLFVLLAVYNLWQLAKTGGDKYYYWSAVWIGLGFGMGYLAILLAPWLALAHLSRNKFKPLKKFFNRNFNASLGILAGLVIFFSLANTHSLLRQFGRVIAIVLSNFGVSVNFASILNVERSSDIAGNFATVFGSLASDLYLLIPFVLLGVYFAAKDRIFNWFEKSLFLGFPMLYYLATLFFFAKAFQRFNAVMIPILLLFGAYGLTRLLKPFGLKKQAWLAGILAVALITPQLITNARFAGKYFVQDTRLKALSWIKENLPNNSQLIINDDDLLNGLIKNKGSILFAKEKIPEWVNTKEEYLLTTPSGAYPKPSYFIYDWKHLNLEKLRRDQVAADYYVVSFWQRDYLKIPEKNKREQWLSYAPKTLVAKFYPTEKLSEIPDLPNSPRQVNFILKRLKSFGPFIEIYKFNQ